MSSARLALLRGQFERAEGRERQYPLGRATLPRRSTCRVRKASLVAQPRRKTFRQCNSGHLGNIAIADREVSSYIYLNLLLVIPTTASLGFRSWFLSRMLIARTPDYYIPNVTPFALALMSHCNGYQDQFSLKRVW